jgi:NAD(P)-dependent dehydrogenase (short-subunit alcohol dehydrogenase family)
MKTWLVTGAARGLGRAIAIAALEAGDAVVLTARQEAALGDIVARFPQRSHALRLDVTRAGDAESAVAAAVARFGNLDVLVNNAGYGLVGAIEELQPNEYRALFDTNVFGLIETTKAALPIFRQQGSGLIVNISSVGGMNGRAGFGLYNASKFAVEGFSEALAEEVAPFGTRVMVVEPGAFRTDFLDARSIVVADRRMPEYDATAANARSHVETDSGAQAGDPRRAALVILDAVNADVRPFRLPLGVDSYRRIEWKLERVAEDIAPWKAAATDTAFK